MYNHTAGLHFGLAGLLAGLLDQGLVDVWNNTTTSNRGLDERVQLLITADGELEMAGRDTLHLEILGGVSGELENLGSQVLQHGSAVHGSGGTNTAVRRNTGLEESVDSSDRELQTRTG